MDLIERLRALNLEFDTSDDALRVHSRDTSIFERTPRVVVYPRNQAEVARLVRCVLDMKHEGEHISITPRAAGTDMTGGPLTDSIVLSYTKHMHHAHVESESVVAEPGIYYRDLERLTLTSNVLIPSYPASRELCALGGMLGNNSGGELTLRYGKTADYVEELEVVLSDGSSAVFKALTPAELESRKQLATLEGEIYRRVHALLLTHRDRIAAARPRVTKNSAGYALWDVLQGDTFDLTRLIVGSQGTLALISRARMRCIRTKPHRAMLVMFLSDVNHLPAVVERVMRSKPESFESYDDHTFKLAVRFLPQIVGQLGFRLMCRLGFAFLPELRMVLTGGVPKLVLMAEFAEDSKQEAREKAREARDALADLPVRTKLALGEMDSKKYWIIRRESFALLRKNLHGYYASPFIDDLVVPIESYPSFIPKLNELLAHYDLIYTIAGHIGNGNFHIIPLMDLSNPQARETILELTPKVYDLVCSYGGSTTGEHNDGIIRTPYLERMFGAPITDLFAEVKNIFDPHGIFNPGKKVGGTEDDIRRFMIRER